MNEKRLTAEQMTLLKPYERHFRYATTAAWSPYPGKVGIDTMLEVWKELTNTPYPYKPGCPHCLMNLVRDMGTIYFANKKAIEETPAKADSVAVEQAEAPKASSKPSEGRSTAKPKKKAKK